jgi:CheY-like chemotaxis protein
MSTPGDITKTRPVAPRHHRRRTATGAQRPPRGSGRPRPLVLIVDTDFHQVELLRKQLSAHYDLISTHRGARALEVLDSWRPDIVIAGIELSDMSGAQFLALARQERHHLPLLRCDELALDSSDETVEDRPIFAVPPAEDDTDTEAVTRKRAVNVSRGPAVPHRRQVRRVPRTSLGTQPGRTRSPGDPDR